MDKMKIWVMLFVQSSSHNVKIMMREPGGLAIQWQEGSLVDPKWGPSKIRVLEMGARSISLGIKETVVSRSEFSRSREFIHLKRVTTGPQVILPKWRCLSFECKRRSRKKKHKQSYPNYRIPPPNTHEGLGIITWVTNHYPCFNTYDHVSWKWNNHPATSGRSTISKGSQDT